MATLTLSLAEHRNHLGKKSAVCLKCNADQIAKGSNIWTKAPHPSFQQAEYDFIKKPPTTATNRPVQILSQPWFLSLHTSLHLFWIDYSRSTSTKAFKGRRAESRDMAHTDGASNCRVPSSAASLCNGNSRKEAVLSWDTLTHSWSSPVKVWLDLIPLTVVTLLRLQVKCYGPLDCQGKSTLGQRAACLLFDDMSATIIFVTFYRRPEKL